MEGSETPKETETDEFPRFTLKVDEINKRSVGKAILELCGNEGSQDNENKAKLRRLMQAIITHMDKERPHIWKNAEVNIYDDSCDVYSILSGDGKTKFVALFDENGSPKIIKSKHAGTSKQNSYSQGCLLT